MSTITTIALGKNGPLVSKLGLGCMRMSSVWGGPTNDESESIATIQMALDRGINFLNTGDFYGHGHNELLVGKAIRDRRDDAFISVKFGAIFYGGRWLGLDLRPIAIKNFINYCLIRLGIETIDLYQPCRLDNSVPVEDVIGTVADLIKEGKVRYLGVSEITAEQLRKAHSIHPVTALEIGYSLTSVLHRWDTSVASWQQSDLSQKEWCRQQDIAYHIFHYWYKVCREEHPQPGNDNSFIKLSVKPEANASCEVVFTDGTKILFREPVAVHYLNT